VSPKKDIYTNQKTLQEFVLFQFQLKAKKSEKLVAIDLDLEIADITKATITYTSI